MDYVNHWNQLFYIYKKCSRIGMLKRNGHRKWYWLGIFLYAVLSILVFLGTQSSVYNVVITIATEFTIAFLVGYVLSWKMAEKLKNAHRCQYLKRSYMFATVCLEEISVQIKHYLSCR